MLNFIKSWKFMAIIIALLTAVVIGLIIFGVTTHTEAGLMANWPRWQRSDFPLAVCGSSYRADGLAPLSDSDRRTLEDVENTINDRLGFAVYRPAVEPSPRHERCRVDVVIGAPSDPGYMDPGGNAQMSGGVCIVNTVNSGPLTDLVLEHELGHCLGLDHDDYESSIMRRVQTPVPDGSYPPRISDSDRQLLRELYAPQH